MNSLPTLFINNLLPILLIASIGYFLGQRLNIDPRSLSRVVFYALSPFLVFDLLLNSQLSSGDMLRIMGFATAQMILIGLITWSLGKVFKLERKLLIAVLLTSTLMNAGNYGLSLNLFAFGESALAQASVFFVTMAILTYTAGVAIASMGTFTLKQSLIELMRIPTIYATTLAMVFNLMEWKFPLPLERATSLLADATIPVMLMLLGLQLQRNRRSWNLKALGVAASMRLLGAPLIAITTAPLFGLRGDAYQANILEAAMPTAVITTVLATEYDLKPAFVTTVIFTTTLLSPLTLTPLLAFLGA